MNISESKAVFDLLAVVAPYYDSDDYSPKTFEAIDAIELLVERARKTLGAGPTVREVMVRIADAKSAADHERMLLLADDAEEWIYADDQEAAR